MEREDVRELSVPELTVRLGEQLSLLVREEMALARAELFASGRQAVLGGGLLTAAALAALGGFGAMIAAAIAAIAHALPLWASAIIVGGALIMTAGGLAALGRARVARSAPPLSMTAASVRRELGELTGRNGHR